MTTTSRVRPRTRYAVLAAATAAIALATTSCTADNGAATPTSTTSATARASTERNSDKWPADWPYDTSWSDATVAGVPCQIGPGPVGHTERYVWPFTPPFTTTVCTQLIPGGHGATYQ